MLVTDVSDQIRVSKKSFCMYVDVFFSQIITQRSITVLVLVNIRLTSIIKDFLQQGAGHAPTEQTYYVWGRDKDQEGNYQTLAFASENAALSAGYRALRVRYSTDGQPVGPIFHPMFPAFSAEVRSR